VGSRCSAPLQSPVPNRQLSNTLTSHRALFCLESAESMLEDFGEVTLTGASIFVKLQEILLP